MTQWKNPRLFTLVLAALVMIFSVAVFGCSSGSSSTPADGDTDGNTDGDADGDTEDDSDTVVDGDDVKTCPVELINTQASGTTEVKWKNETEIEYAKLHTGRYVTPAGVYINQVGTMPTGSALSPDGRWLAVACSGGKDYTLEDHDMQSVRIIDTQTNTVAKTLVEQETFLGVAFSSDSKRLYVSGGIDDTVHVYDVEYDFLKLHTLKLPGVPFGLALTSDNRYLLVAISQKAKVYQIDTATYEIVAKYDVLTYPWSIVVNEDNTAAYVSNVGNNAISTLNLTTHSTRGHVSVGKNPEGLALHGGNLYVANNDDDTISVIDVATLSVSSTIDLRENENDAPGRMPVDVKINADGTKLYVTLASENSVGVVDLAQGKLIGEIPTAFYPAEIELTADKLYVVNAKGLGTGPNFDAEDPEATEDKATGIFYGGVNILPIPDETTLATYTAQVRDNNQNAMHYFGADCDNWDSPIPTKIGVESKQIKHVVWIIKENKTYDVLLGDLAGEQGDDWHMPSLAYFGENTTIAVQYAGYPADTRYNITPNTHELARHYVDMVNFYDNSIKSTEGHMWLTGGWLNDFGEKFSLIWQVRGEKVFMLPNIDPVSRPSTGDIFSHLLQHGKSVRVYGEFVGTASELFGDSFDYLCHSYLPGITAYDDTKKIEVFEREFNNGIFRNFTLIWIPNDHTMGMDAGAPHPAYMVSDNDEALGRIVEIISHSDHWKETVIFAFQDDPQNTPDHIDTHRSIFLAASPWIKRGYRSTLSYDMTNVHRTTMQILGVPPISRYEALASPMYDIFTTEADFDPYTLVPQDPKLSDKSKWIIPADDELAAMTEKMSFKTPDDQPGLGRVLWYAMVGKDVPYPAHLINDARDDDDDDDDVLGKPEEDANAPVADSSEKGGE
jgi:YVTN family beta-propeller protein